MTPAQIRTIRASFARMEPALPYLGHRYYERLFASAPELRALLGSDIDGQQKRLTDAMCQLVSRRSSMALPAVASKDGASSAANGAAARHGGIDISPDYLAIMRGTLLVLLADELGSDFTEQVEDAWRTAFDVLTRILMDDLARLPTAQDQFFDRLGKDAGSEASGEAALHAFFK